MDLVVLDFIDFGFVSAIDFGVWIVLIWWICVIYRFFWFLNVTDFGVWIVWIWGLWVLWILDFAC